MATCSCVVLLTSARAQEGSRIYEALVSGWAQSWQSQDFEGYAGLYSPQFSTPAFPNRQAWLSFRQPRVELPQSIEVRVYDPRVLKASADRMLVEFVQFYSSDRLSVYSLKKQVWAKEGETWRIRAEEALDLPKQHALVREGLERPLAIAPAQPPAEEGSAALAAQALQAPIAPAAPTTPATPAKRPAALVNSDRFEGNLRVFTPQAYQQSPIHEVAKQLIDEVENPQSKPPFSTLKRDINSVFNSVPAVLASRDAFNAINAQKEQAFAGFLPRVTLSAGAGETDQTQITSTSKGSTNTYSLNVSQHLYDFGATAGSYDASVARYAAGENVVYNQRNEIILKLLTSTLDVQRAKKNLLFGRGYVNTRREFLNLIKERESLKAASSLDVIRAEAKLAEAIDDMTALSRQLENNNASYRELFGRLPSFKETGFQLPNVRLDSSDDLNAKLNGLRAYQEHELKLIAAKREYDAAKGKLFGAIVLEGTSSRTHNPGGLRATEVNTVQFLYKVDVFTGFAQTARAKELAAKQSEASFERDRLQRELLKRLETTRAGLRAAQDSLQARLLLLKRSQATDLATRELFVLGKATLTDTFKAQEDYFAAAQKLVNAEFEYNLAFYTVLSVNEQLLEQFDLTI